MLFQVVSVNGVPVREVDFAAVAARPGPVVSDWDVGSNALGLPGRMAPARVHRVCSGA